MASIIPIRRVVFNEDVPSEHWLNEQIAYAKSQKRSEYSVPYMGKITGWFTGFPELPVERLAKLQGELGEQENVRPQSLDYLIPEMQKNGLVNVSSPFIIVGFDGVPWVSEGNHRIMAAKLLGWKTMPVEIRYFDGGHRQAGEFSPEVVMAHQGKIAQSSDECEHADT